MEVLTRFSTRIAGVASGEKVTHPVTREEVYTRQWYLEMLQDSGIKVVDLIQEPTNSYDENAVAVFVTLPAGRVQLGYIPNASAVCGSCNKKFNPPIPNTCPVCSQVDPATIFPVDRIGLATKITSWLNNGYKFKARVMSIGRTSDGKYLGASLEIERIQQ